MLEKAYSCVLVENAGDGITWVTLNRPEKRNAMNPTLHYEMEEILTALETDADTKVIVLTGAGQSWNGGMDLKEFFRETDNNPDAQFRALTAARHWQWELLSRSRKPTIAMVNGFCFGAGFISLCACDFVIAADDATFGLSEINWGIIPGGIVSKVVADVMSYRDALFYACTGRTFDGRKAVEMKLANIAVPRDSLRAETEILAKELMEKGATVLAYTKQALRAVVDMDHDTAYEYLRAKMEALQFTDRENTRARGIEEFIDKKTFRPGLGAVKKG